MCLHTSLLARRRLCGWLVIAALATARLGAQTRDLATVEGEVHDPQGARVAGADVTLRNSKTGLRRVLQSDAAGRYTFVGLPITDNYTVHVEADSFRGSEKTGIALRPGVTATIDFTLAASGPESQVTVTGLRGSIQGSSDLVSTNLDLARIEAAPIANNRATSLVLLDSAVRPAISTGDLFTNETLFVINGGGRRQTTWSVDNGNANESWGRQSLFTSLPLVSIEEFQIITDAMPSEYGWTSGSAVNIVTRSGSNEFHGDLLGTGRPAFSQANTPLAVARATNTLAQGSGSISGPIRHDRTWLHIAGESSSQTRAAVITSPLAYGSTFDGQFNQTLFLARLDHQVSSSNRLTLRLSGDRFTDTNPADGVSGATLPTAARSFERNTYGAYLGDVATLGPNTLNELRLQFQLASPVTRFTPVLYGPQIFATGYYTYGDSRSANLMNHQYSLADTVSHVQGRHTLKAGFDLTHSSSGGFGQEFGGGYVQGRFQVNARYATVPVAQILPLDPGVAPAGQPAGAPALVSSYTQSFGNQSYNVREFLTGAFLQDDWKATHNLTLNLGVRYEQQTYFGDGNNVAPRVGLAYRLPISRPASIRSGYGVFFSEIRANQAAGYALGDPLGVFSFTAAPGQCGFPASFAPFSSVQALLSSANCATPGASPSVPLRTLTVAPGQAGYLNRFFDVGSLRTYPRTVVNPYTQQWNLGAEMDLGRSWILSLDYVGTRGLKIERALELNAPTAFVRTAPGQTRSVAAANASRPVRPATNCTTASASFSTASGTCFNNFSSIQALANAGDSYYEGGTAKLSHQLGARASALFTYTYSHAINTYEQDAAGTNPNDWNNVSEGERASAALDQRHRAVLSGWYRLPFDVTLAGVAQLAAGFPFNAITGVDNNGDGSVTDRPIVNGAVLGRNSGRGSAIYTFDPSLQKTLTLHDRLQVSLRAEAFNVLNHANFYNRNTTYGDAQTVSPTFGAKVGGISSTGAARQMQLLMRIRF